jgi:hypothetical protein
MGAPGQRRPLLSLEAIQRLQDAKQQIVDAAYRRIPERLVLATVEAAGRLARREPVPAEIMSKCALELVRETLQNLAQGKWKPETALKLGRPVKGGGHGLSH